MQKDRRENGNTMCAADAIALRVADFCRTEWPSAKHMAAALGIAVVTAEKIRAGHRPQNRLMDKLAAMYRWDFLARVYEPVAGSAPIAVSVHQDLEDLRTRLAALDERIAAAMKEEA